MDTLCDVYSHHSGWVLYLDNLEMAKDTKGKDPCMKVVIKGKGSITLGKNNYKAAGGQGTVYCKDGVAYKIYHDPKKMVSPAKIIELNKLKMSNVLAPQDILYDENNNTIGFTMPYISDVEFLCKLFVKSFRDKNSIDPKGIVDLVKKMQETLSAIHKEGFLVVDYNEMNFLLSKDFKTPYYIDVDSYKTPSFPPTALMESVRDRVSPKNQFTELTDWFSWAVVTFQLYIGSHPYKGRHPSYKPKDWMKMMDDNVSVFHQDVRLPANCQDWSVIPKRHLEWYKRVFRDKERSVPPYADQIGPLAVAKPILISGTDKFEIKYLEDFPSPIRKIKTFGGIRYTIVDGEIYANKKKIFTFNRKAHVELCEVAGGNPIVAFQMPGFDIELVHTALSGIEGSSIGRISADAMMELNGNIYTVRNGNLTENVCTIFGNGKVVHHSQIVCSVFEPAFRMFRGLVAQDIMGKCWLAIPYKSGTCHNIHISELDGYRLLDAEYMSGFKSGFCVVIGEKKGRYDRFIIHFMGDHSFQVNIRMETDVETDTVNVTVLPNDLCVMVVNDLNVQAFFDNTKVKVVDKPPFDSSMRLFHEGMTVMFANRHKLHTVRLK